MTFEAGERISVKVEREDVDWSADDLVGTLQVKREPWLERKKLKRKKLKRDLFKCEEPNCQYSTKYKGNLYQHASVHSDERPHKCHKCEKTYKTSKYLKRHLEIHSKETPFQCDECEKKFISRKYLKHHLKSHSEEIPFQCDECERAFKLKGHFNFHKSTHKNRNEWYKCHECDYSSPHKRVFKLHETTHLKFNPIKCEHCDYSCKSKQNLAHHFRVKHSSMEPWRCDHPDCQYATREKSNLKRHTDTIHESKKPFNCEECKRAYKTKFQLKIHLLVHTRIKSFKCPKCQYSSLYQVNVQRHERRRHVNEKEHKCGASYRLKNDLEKHLLNHNDSAKTFKCNLCPFRAPNKLNLNRHSQSHKNKGRYKCDECDRSFYSAAVLKRHRFTHLKIKNLSCVECDYRTNNPANLKRHQLVSVHSVSNASNEDKCVQCGLALLDQSDSAIHSDAHRPCSVSLSKLPDSGDVIVDVNASPLLLRVKIELNDHVIKKEID